MIEELNTLHRLLMKYSCYGQAEVLNNLIELLEPNSPIFSEKINSIDMWGGSGAVWEVCFINPEVSKQELKVDKLTFEKAIVSLVKKMKSKGICGKLAKNRASIIKKWL